LDIKVNVGRTGTVTPVAILEPVECGGVIIRNSTLHNFDEIERLGIRKGDKILIERAGEVIPKVLKVIDSARTGKEKKFSIPKNCPACNEPVVKEKEEDVAYRCINPSCPAQLERGLEHFASRQALDIEGMGESVVSQLVAKKLVKNFADIYKLDYSDLAKLELFKDKKIKNLLRAINISKKQPLSRLIYALGIRHVGEKAAITLARKFQKMDNLLNARRESLELIPEIGPVMADSIYEFFNKAKTRALIEQLEEAGLNMQENFLVKKSKITGKHLVFTGSLKNFSRTQAEQVAREFGADISSSLTANTDLLVAGVDPGSKFDKARKLSIKIIDEREFLNLITEGEK
jgi:DNA ligase (NAD+)